MLGLLIALGTATDPGLERVIRIRNEAGRTNRPPCRKSALEKSQELPIAKMGALNSGSNGVTRGRQSKRTSIPPDVPLGQRSMKGKPGLGAFPRDRRRIAGVHGCVGLDVDAGIVGIELAVHGTDYAQRSGLRQSHGASVSQDQLALARRGVVGQVKEGDGLDIDLEESEVV